MHYNEEQFKQEFPNSELGQRFLATVPSWIDVSYAPYVDSTKFQIPREIVTTVSVTSFFYIQKLLEKEPTVIADIGCGKNFFKNFIPSIHGIDPIYKEYADEVDYFDKDFVQGHQEQFDCAMAINSLHFINIKDFQDTLTDFAKIIKPGGRGYITFNLSQIKDKTPTVDWIDNVSEYFKQQVDSVFTNVLVYDDYINNTKEESLDGNIRIVFEKEQ